MSKLLSYLLPGLILAAAFTVANMTIIPEEIHKADWFSFLTILLYPACVIVPSIIYFVRNPPGHGMAP